MGLLEAPPADQAAGQRDEGVVEFEASFPADGEAFELVEKGEGLLDDVAELAQALDVRDALAGDHRHDPAFAQFTADGPGVVCLVAQHGAGAVAGMALAAGHWRDAVDEGEGLGDVVDVRRGGDDVERGTASVADQVVFATRFPAVDRRRAGRGSPFFARMWEPSTHARDQSSSPAAFSFSRSRRCNCSKTPVCCQRSRRRQQVCPDPNPSSRGRSCQAMS